jgi:8-oxo-dGTP diphosphatase
MISETRSKPFVRPGRPSVSHPAETLAKRLRLRQAVRAVVLDEADRILLVRFGFPDGSVWALPGGGKEPGEDDAAALRREMAEEVGLVDFDTVGPIWERTHAFRVPTAYDGQAERIYLIRVDGFEPSPQMTWDELNREGMMELRWWDQPSLQRSESRFAPTRLPALVVDLLAKGAPAETIDVGE